MQLVKSGFPDLCGERGGGGEEEEKVLICRSPLPTILSWTRFWFSDFLIMSSNLCLPVHLCIRAAAWLYCCWSCFYIDQLKERGVEKLYGWRSTFWGWEWSVLNLTNFSTVSRQLLEDCWGDRRNVCGPLRVLWCCFVWILPDWFVILAIWPRPESHTDQHHHSYFPKTNWVEPPERYHRPSKVRWQLWIGSGKSQYPIVPANCSPPTVAPLPVNGWLATYWSRSRSRPHCVSGQVVRVCLMSCRYWDRRRFSW